MAVRTKEQVRLAAARRQREYRQRREEERMRLSSLQYDSDVLEDSIKMLANAGHPLAVQLVKAVSRPDLQELADYFRCEVETFKAPRSASCNRKKPATAKRVAVAGL